MSERDGLDPEPSAVKNTTKGERRSTYFRFVYDTLRAGEANDIAMAAAHHGISMPRLLGRATVPGRLSDFGDYPDLIPAAAAGPVLGEIYPIDAALFPVLDEVEAVYPGEVGLFLRIGHPVELDGQ